VGSNKRAHARSWFDSDEPVPILLHILEICAFARRERYRTTLARRKKSQESVTMSSSKCVKQPRKAYTKEQHEMTHSEKLRLIDDELNSFYK